MKAKEALAKANEIRGELEDQERNFLLAAIAKASSCGDLAYLYHGHCSEANRMYLRSLGYTVEKDDSRRYLISWDSPNLFDAWSVTTSIIVVLLFAIVILLVNNGILPP